MAEGRVSARVAAGERGALKYWLGVPVGGGAERLGWILSMGIGLYRMAVLIAVQAGKCLFWLTVGLSINAALAFAYGGLFSQLPGSPPLASHVALGMAVTLFLSLVSMLRVGVPDVRIVALGALVAARSASFHENMVGRVQAVAESALQMPDDHRAAARFWYARRFVFAELIAYVLVCIILFSTFMTSVLVYLEAIDVFDRARVDDVAELFLYYFQLGFDGSFFNMMDLAGIELSDRRPIEPFGLRLIRFAIYTLYLGRVAGYVTDVLAVPTEDTRTALLERVGLSTTR